MGFLLESGQEPLVAALLLVVWRGGPDSVLAPSSTTRSPLVASLAAASWGSYFKYL